MTERELLELAAKAAGIDTKECPVFEYGVDWGGKAGIWNPLTDDGDALRLAVKLRLDVEFLRGGDFVKVSTYYGDVTAEVEHAGDPLADTRRAIVRAAAEIGKGMGVGE